MADVFISYAREDRARAEHLARAIEAQGWSVWWDRIIPPGRTFDEVIEEQLQSASCVIVMWSRTSAASEWVKNEASDALGRGILLPALIDDVQVPLEFRRVQAANLADWSGTGPHPELTNLFHAISDHVPRPSADVTAEDADITKETFAPLREVPARSESVAAFSRSKKQKKVAWVTGISSAIAAISLGLGIWLWTLIVTNHAPVAVADHGTTTVSSPVDLNVLANDSDADSDTLSVTDASIASGKGLVTVNSDGTLTYDPSTDYDYLVAGETASVTISYTVSDGNGGTDTGTATVAIETEPLALGDPNAFFYIIGVDSSLNQTLALSHYKGFPNVYSGHLWPVEEKESKRKGVRWRFISLEKVVGREVYRIQNASSEKFLVFDKNRGDLQMLTEQKVKSLQVGEMFGSYWFVHPEEKFPGLYYIQNDLNRKMISNDGVIYPDGKLHLEEQEVMGGEKTSFASLWKIVPVR